MFRELQVPKFQINLKKYGPILAKSFLVGNTVWDPLTLSAADYSLSHYLFILYTITCQSRLLRGVNREGESERSFVRRVLTPPPLLELRMEPHIFLNVAS